MTDAELSSLEAAAKAATPGPDGFVEYKSSGVYGHTENWTKYYAAANPAAILELIAELRQAKAERDWLAEQIEGYPCGFLDCPFNLKRPFCRSKKFSEECWLQAAKEAVCQK